MALANPDPAFVYREHHQERQREAERLTRIFNRLANARLLAFLAIIGLLVLTFWRGWAPWWIVIPASIFAVLLAWHARVAARRRLAERGLAYFARGLDRIQESWSGRGETGERFLDLHHPYAADLDLFGQGSLFQLLCTARTAGGEATLARWLLHSAAADVVRDRQDAVRELSSRLDFREALAVMGDQARSELHATALAEWGRAQSLLTSQRQLWALHAAVLLTLAALVAWLGFDLGSWPFVGCLCAEGVLGILFHRRASEVLRRVEDATADVALLATLLERIEGERFEAALLICSQNRLLADGQRPSASLAALGKTLEWLHARRNQFFTPLALILLWRTRHAFAVDAWRVRHGEAIATWLEAVAEFEALAALATYAFEHPADPFPSIVDAGPVYQGAGLGHPLLASRECVCNDVSLGDGVRLLVVSGSNMSGKSTLLRTVGVNAVLALAGAPVRAVSLQLSPLSVGATLRIQDSLQAGQSRFYAEIVRMRQLVDLASGPVPLLFLLDEIFHGTNSHDRRHGAAALLTGLLAKNAIGLVTTHDLALTELVAQLGGRAANVHFADHLENGAMQFDYVMRPGVTTHSNALALMRAVGLEV